MARLSRLFSLSLMVLLLVSVATPAWACPFCSGVSQTFSEEITASPVAVFAKLVKLPAPTEDEAVRIDVNAPPPKATFEVTEVVKGDTLLPDLKQIEVIYFGESAIGQEFLILGIEPPKVEWSTPIQVSERAREYIKTVMTLPAEGAERLAFVQKYLEDPEEMLTRDAYDEFARASYDSVKALKPQMDHDQLVAWIWNSEVPASRKRLYLTMLSVCGGKQDLLMLETMIKASDSQAKLGLDAALGCYLTLKGPEGVTLIEDMFLKNKDAEYTDIHAAIMALRFHAEQSDLIPKERIKVAFRYMLEQPKLADLIIPDLARMEDWEVMDRMVRLFKEADTGSSWVRVPVVNYLRACPLPEAKQHIEELAKIDPEAVDHANSFFPLAKAGPEAASRAGAEAAATETESPKEEQADEESPTKVQAAKQLNPPAPKEDNGASVDRKTAPLAMYRPSEPSVMPVANEELQTADVSHAGSVPGSWLLAAGGASLLAVWSGLAWKSRQA